MIDDMRYTLPEPEAQPWLRSRTRQAANRRSVLGEVLTGTAVGAGFQIVWPGMASARVLKSADEKGWGSVKGRIVWPTDRRAAEAVRDRSA